MCWEIFFQSTQWYLMDALSSEENSPPQYLPTINALVTGGMNLRRNTEDTEIKNKVNANRIINRDSLEKNSLIFTTYHNLSDE